MSAEAVNVTICILGGLVILVPLIFKFIKHRKLAIEGWLLFILGILIICFGYKKIGQDESAKIASAEAVSSLQTTLDNQRYRDSTNWNWLTGRFDTVELQLRKYGILIDSNFKVTKMPSVNNGPIINNSQFNNNRVAGMIVNYHQHQPKN
jgi:hypothetical protein